jgi:hypothetical protein
MTSHGNPEQIKKVCEWTGKEFTVDWKHRHQRFIDKSAMYAWRKVQNREFAICPTCKNPFERYKRILHPMTGKLTQYCSNNCSRKSKEKKEKLRMWIKDNQPMDNPNAVLKIRQSKLLRYGDPIYNNLQKGRKTMMDRYGVACYFDLPTCKSNGKRISKFQRRKYEEILINHPDAELERYLKDVQRAVDIYIPSLRKVIECHGDYWHCNPNKYPPDYYNKLIHLTATEVWERDRKKKQLLEISGYTVEVVWESTSGA